MGGLVPQSEGKTERTATWIGVEVILVLIILCLAASVAGVLVFRPLIQAEIGKNAALDMILSASVPTDPGETCGRIVSYASEANQAVARWRVDPINQTGDYLITVNIQRGAETAVFHWNVDTQTGSISSQETRSICQLP